MRKDKSASIGTPGAVSLIATFAVLSIAIFAILVLSTTLSDKNRADRTYELTDNYYAADCEAEKIIAEMRNDKDMGQHDIVVYVGDTMELQVSVDIQEDSVTINKWKLESIVPWESDDSLDLAG